jgi:hypothetical protein
MKKIIMTFLLGSALLSIAACTKGQVAAGAAGAGAGYILGRESKD